MKLLFKKITMSVIIILVLVFSAVACTSLPPAPQLVEVPIATKCNPTVKITPITEYVFDKAKKDMSLYETSQLALSELSTVRGQNKELTAALKECTK